MYFVDLGNRNFKLITKEGKEKNPSNIQEVTEGTFASWKIGNKYYLIGEGAEAKFDTNKITETKRALLGRVLYPYVSEGDKIELATLLPLSLYSEKANREKYKELLKGKYSVENSNGIKKTFTVTNVDVCCEGFSSLVTDMSLFKAPIYLVDIGGVDLSMCYVDQIPVSAKSDSKEKGMNIFFEELAKKLTSTKLESYSNRDAELLMERYSFVPEEVKNIIDEFTNEYIQNNIYKRLKRIGYKPEIHGLVFVGGGSMTLEKFITQNPNATVLDNSLWTNVEGARLIVEGRNK